MAGQKNELAPRTATGPEARPPQAPSGSFSRPGPAIPRRVAPQQSPTPFHRTREAYLHLPPHAAAGPKTGQTRPPAPAPTAERAPRLPTLPDGRENRLSHPHNPLHRHHRHDIVNSTATSVHLSILTRPSVAGSNTPSDINIKTPDPFTVPGGHRRVLQPGVGNQTDQTGKAERGGVVGPFVVGLSGS